MKVNFNLSSATMLSKNEMKSVKGGIPAKEYCERLLAIMLNPQNHEDGNISPGACEGAAEGARRAGCNFTISCN